MVTITAIDTDGTILDVEAHGDIYAAITVVMPYCSEDYVDDLYAALLNLDSRLPVEEFSIKNGTVTDRWTIVRDEL